MDMDDDSIWEQDPKVLSESEWSRLSSNFTNAGYREGITAGKESALQQGFDEGFAEVGAPLGRELGILRGMSTALLSFLKMAPDQTGRQELIREVGGLVSQLGSVRLSDIAPPDLEAERHIREHLDDDGGEDAGELDVELNEELKEKRDIEKIEDLMVQMQTGSLTAGPTKRPSMDDVLRIKERLIVLCQELNMSVQWS